MPRLPKLSFRLTPALQAALSDRVGQGQQASDIMREALEASLGVRPTAGPIMEPTSPTLSDAVCDLSSRLTMLAADSHCGEAHRLHYCTQVWTLGVSSRSDLFIHQNNLNETGYTPNGSSKATGRYAGGIQTS
jgi:hypothetical protein